MSTDSPQATKPSQQALQIGDWVIDTAACRFERDGKGTRVEPKVMQVLECLVERAGQVVSRQELEELVWAGTVVGYDAVTNAVIKLRKALEDDARAPRIIETISKHGYRLIAEVGSVTPRDDVHGPGQKNTIGLIAVLFALGIAGALGWMYVNKPAVVPTSIDDMAFPLPKEPSIAVMPFDNLSGKADQEYLSDGLTEDIITALAKSPYLFVIARNSTFAYKDEAVSVKQVAEQLGVRHVLEGSVQRSGNRIRITAQLIDALTGRHIWAEHYDREFKDIFTLQDEITEKIMVALHVKITEGEDYRAFRARVRSPEAFEYLMKSRVHMFRGNKEDNAIRRELVAKAAAIEPDNPEVWLYQAWGHWGEYQNGWSNDRKASFKMAAELGEKAYAADPNDSAITGFMGVLSLSRGRHEEAVAFGRKSVALAPSSALDNARLAWFLSVSGNPEEAILLVEKAMRLSPSYPAWFASVLGFAFMLTEDYEKAISAYEQLVKRKSHLPRAYVRLAGIHAILGNDDKAQKYAVELLRIKPKFTIQGWKKSLRYRYPDDMERELSMLRLAGLPER